MANYIAYIHKDAGSGFGVSFPDFPGCVTAAATLAEAVAEAREALDLHIEGMVAEGMDIPAPSDLDALADDPARDGAVVALVSVETVDPVVPVNISMRKSQRDAIDRKAKAAGKTRAGYIVERTLAG